MNATSDSTPNAPASEIPATLGIILAAGMGKRMKSALPKVAHTLLGKPLVLWAIDALQEAGVRDIVVVLSPAQTAVAELVRARLADPLHASGSRVHVAWQPEAKGTGHAALCGLNGAIAALPELSARLESTDVIVGFGDTPAVRAETFARYLASHRTSGSGVTVFAFEPADPSGYGRVLTAPSGAFRAIREEKDCTAEERATRLANSGFLCARADLLHTLLPALRSDNAAGEYYLTDVPAAALARAERVGVFLGTDEREVAGVNSQSQLAAMACYVQRRVVDARMAEGVQFLNPDAVYLEPTVTFGTEVVLEPFTYLAGFHHVPSGARVEAGSRVVASKNTR